MPIIILEGIDGSGKTTLAKNLAALSPWPTNVIHRGPIKTSVTEELIDPLFNVKPDELLIADRWHLSELIYGPLYRKSSKIDIHTLMAIESLLNKLDAMRIIVKPQLQTVISRLEERGEDFLQPVDHLLVYSAYAGLAQELGYEVVTFSDRQAAKAILTRLQGTVR